MKRTLLALSIAAAVALPVVAQAAPRVYGKINVSVEDYKLDVQNTPAKSFEQTRLVSNASRFGVAGDEELAFGFNAIYQIEWEVAMDGEDAAGISATSTTVSTPANPSLKTTTTISSSKTDLTQRNRFVGLKSDYGTIKLGKYDSYTKLAQAEIDLFNDYEGDMKYVIAGENRLNNVVGYESPRFFDVLTVNVQTQTQDASSTSGNTANRKNGSSASIVYKDEMLGFYAALAADKSLDGATAVSGSRESDNMRVVLAYTNKDLGLGVNGIYQTSDASIPVKAAALATGTNDKESGWQLGVFYKISQETLKLQYGEAEADNAKATTLKHTLLSVGVDHAFTKTTKAFVWATQKEEDKLAANSDSKISLFAIGMETKF